MKWISYGQTLPKRFAMKRDCVLRGPHEKAVRVEFNFEIAWIVRDSERRVLMPNGGWAETFDFHLRTPGHVIGLADMTTANAHEWSQEWREAMADRRLGR